MLRRGRLTRNVTVPVSAGLLREPEKYFEALTDYRDGDIDAIVHAVAHAVFAAVGNGRTLADDIRATRSQWSSTVRARRDSSVHRLLDLLLAQPVVTSSFVAQRLGISAVTAGTAIDRLVGAGILTQAGGGRRYRIWQAPEVIAALDSFAERARRGRF